MLNRKYVSKVVAWLIGRGRNKRNTVLFIGLSDAGKTLLFTRVSMILLYRILYHADVHNCKTNHISIVALL